MKRLHFLKYFLHYNWGKVLTILSILICSIILLKSSKQPHKYDVVGEFTHNLSGVEYIAYNLNNKIKITEKSIGYLDPESNSFTIIEHTIRQVFISLYIFVSTIIFFLMRVSNDFPWNRRFCLAQSGKYYVKVYEENSIYYYKYNNKLLTKSKKLLNSDEIQKNVYTFLGNPNNLYPDYEGPTQIVRGRKLNDLLL